MYARHVYVHVPFCARRCAYCDFAIAVRSRPPVDAYVAAIESELAIRFPTAGEWPVDTLYLGGGTPSLLGAEGVARLVQALRARVTLAPDAEVSIEANPDDVTPEAAARWRESGINRVSLGAQSFEDRVLAWMHRTHDAARIPLAARALGEAGLANWSLDLIFSLPLELGRDWTGDVERALALEPAHVSLYGLTFEAGTALARWRDRGEVIEPPEEVYERQYLFADSAMAAHGFEHYEVSNFARPGRRSRHNASYWSDVPYVGVGPSAHGYDGRQRRWNISSYARWIAAVHDGTDPLAGFELLSVENRIAEQVYLGLRTSAGLSLRDGEVDSIARWVDNGWARVENGRLQLSPSGWLRLDTLAEILTSLRSC